MPHSLTQSRPAPRGTGKHPTATELTVGRGNFEPTQWSLVWAAGRESEFSAAALEKLCRAYLPPVRAFLRREGHSMPDTEDLAQEFFYRLLAANSFASASAEKGRFRSWLIGALKHFLHNEWRKGMAQRRGGGQAVISFDAMEPATRAACEPRENETPETAYDRNWAETVVARVHNRMRREFELAGQLARWEILKCHLLHGAATPSYEGSAEQLGLTESAVKSAIYKLRQRFSTVLRHEVAQTVANPDETEDELRALIQVLREG